MKVSECFTNLSILLEEIDSMNTLPAITTVTTKITALLTVIHTMKEESKLFQFLNGLDDVYGAQWSQLHIMYPLPSVEVACSAVQQEESQKEVLTQGGMNDADMLAMYSKGNTHKVLSFTTCGRKGHTSDKCWETIGYPQWHYKHKSGQKQTINKWSRNKRNNVPGMANNAQGNVNNEQAVTMTTRRLDQLLKLIPRGGTSSVQESETDEEIDYGFYGMVNSNKESTMESMEWIIDSGASDHMTSSLKNFVNVKLAPSTYTITLPTSATTFITHVGDVTLPSGLKLKNALHVP